MSNTISKNLILSQPKIGQGENHALPSLKQTTTTVDNKTVVEIEIPGVDPATVSVDFDGGTLLVSCPKGASIIPLPHACDTSAIDAEILWGMLTLTIPMPAPPVAHSIKVNIAGSAPKKVSETKTVSKFTEKD